MKQESNIFQVSEDNKAIKLFNDMIDLDKESGGENKVFQMGFKFYGFPLYNSDEDTPVNSSLQIPNSDGRFLMFNKSKTDLGTVGDYITNMDTPGKLGNGHYGCIMGISKWYYPYINYETRKLIDELQYRFRLWKQDTQITFNDFVNAVPEKHSLSGIIPEQTLTDAGMTDGQHAPISYPDIVHKASKPLDPTRYILLKENDTINFEVKPNPSKLDLLADIPYPGHTDPKKQYRIWLYFSLDGMYTDVR